jgi:hypothetical protein
MAQAMIHPEPAKLKRKGSGSSVSEEHSVSPTRVSAVGSYWADVTSCERLREVTLLEPSPEPATLSVARSFF